MVADDFDAIAAILLDPLVFTHRVVVAGKPTPELEPFFKLFYECHAKYIAGDPGGLNPRSPP